MAATPLPSIPEFADFAGLDAASRALEASVPHVADALTVWAASRMADFLTRRPCIAGLGIHRFRGALTSPRILPWPRPPKQPPPAPAFGWREPQALTDAFLSGMPDGQGGQMSPWDDEERSEIDAAFEEADSWASDSRFGFLLNHAGGFGDSFHLSLDFIDEPIFERGILRALGREDLWTRLEASRVAAACSHTSSRLPNASRI